jgi:hypothetical protein
VSRWPAEYGGVGSTPMRVGLSPSNAWRKGALPSCSRTSGSRAADHINVILVSNADVTKTSDLDPTKIVDLGALKGTTGMQDYAVPAEMSTGAMGYHTVVLWDTAMKHAIAAAPLTMK